MSSFQKTILFLFFCIFVLVMIQHINQRIMNHPNQRESFAGMLYPTPKELGINIHATPSGAFSVLNETATPIPENKKTRIAFASLIRNPVDLPLWLKYHRNLGIKRFFIRLEDSPSWEEYLENMPDVVLEKGESSKDGNNYSTLISRQITYVNQTMQRANQMDDIDWLIHIDCDELLHGDISIISKLADHTKTFKLENAEAIFDKKQHTCFSATNFLRCGKNAPCKSYVNGKPGGKLHDNSVVLAGPHEFSYKNQLRGDFFHQIPFETLHILHFEGCTFSAWIDKFYHLSQNDKSDMPFKYYKESIESAKEAHKLYEKTKMPSKTDFSDDHVYSVDNALF